MRPYDTVLASDDLNYFAFLNKECSLVVYYNSNPEFDIREVYEIKSEEYWKKHNNFILVYRTPKAYVNGVNHGGPCEAYLDYAGILTITQLDLYSSFATFGYTPKQVIWSTPTPNTKSASSYSYWKSTTKQFKLRVSNYGELQIFEEDLINDPKCVWGTSLCLEPLALANHMKNIFQTHVIRFNANRKVKKVLRTVKRFTQKYTVHVSNLKQTIAYLINNYKAILTLWIATFSKEATELYHVTLRFLRMSIEWIKNNVRKHLIQLDDLNNFKFKEFIYEVGDRFAKSTRSIWDRNRRLRGNRNEFSNRNREQKRKVKKEYYQFKSQ